MKVKPLFFLFSGALLAHETCYSTQGEREGFVCVPPVELEIRYDRVRLTGVIEAVVESPQSGPKLAVSDIVPGERTEESAFETTRETLIVVRSLAPGEGRSHRSHRTSPRKVRAWCIG